MEGIDAGEWIVAYDIKADAARGKVAHLLQERGYRIQKSVFRVELTNSELATLHEVINGVIDPVTDRFISFRQCVTCQHARAELGQPVEAELRQLIFG